MSSAQQFYATDDESTADDGPEEETASDTDWSDDSNSSEDDADDTPTDTADEETGATALPAKTPLATAKAPKKTAAPKMTAAPKTTAKAAPKTETAVTPTMQMAMHKMLTYLQQWWKDSERLLQTMVAHNLPCDSLKKMSNDIDQMLDKAIGKIAKGVLDPSVFPIADIVHVARNMKRYVFLKVGEICCQAGNEDKCAKAANVALVTLKKFRNSANNVYDEMIAQVLQAMDSASDEEDELATPDMTKLLKQMRM